MAYQPSEQGVNFYWLVNQQNLVYLQGCGQPALHPYTKLCQLPITGQTGGFEPLLRIY